MSGSGLGTSALATHLRREISALDPEVPVADIRAVETVIAQTTPTSGSQPRSSRSQPCSPCYWRPSDSTACSRISSATANKRSVRMALGATRGDILAMIMGRSLLITGLGVGIGIAGNALLGDVLADLLFEVGTLDPVAIVGAAATLLGIGAAASLVPARRATAVDPVVALRAE